MRDLLHRVHCGLMLGRVTDECGVDVVRHGVAEREGVRRDEQRAHDDRQDGDDHRAFRGGSVVLCRSAHRASSFVRRAVYARFPDQTPFCIDATGRTGFPLTRAG
jgi:hypothetical protein